MRYQAIIPVDGEVRRITFDAADLIEAKRVAAACNAGLEGEAIPDAVPEAFGVQKTRELLGGVSRGTIYNWLAVGRLDRVPGTRRVLVTRSSIERAARSS
jgi:hypothetical protein